MTYTDLIKAVSTDANCSQTLVKQIIETLRITSPAKFVPAYRFAFPLWAPFPLQSVRNASAATPLRGLPS